jgi:Trk-type K+ transport system membrane component
MSKIVMTGLMLIGRLEVFTILVLFTPQFWRQD